MTPLVRETMSIIVAHSFSIHSRPFISFWICGMLMGASGRAAAWLSVDALVWCVVLRRRRLRRRCAGEAEGEQPHALGHEEKKKSV